VFRDYNKKRTRRLVCSAPDLLWSVLPSSRRWSCPIRYRFSTCEVDVRLYQLRKEGKIVTVEPKVFDVAPYLLYNRDRVVSKDELLEKLWIKQVVNNQRLALPSVSG
jgi:DNA-binding response OmpR family regulator